jgi:hypothetical protein
MEKCSFSRKLRSKLNSSNVTSDRGPPSRDHVLQGRLSARTVRRTRRQARSVMETNLKLV